MVAAVTIDTSQAFTLGLARYTAADLLAAQAFTLAAGVYQSPTVRLSEAFALSAITSTNEIRSSQAFVLATCTGRVSDPHVRVWTYTLDGHDFYVLRLGNDETILYDLSTEQWTTFGSGDDSLWRAYNGTNWLGADPIAASYGSNVVVGDDGNGALYFLDPDGDTDDDALYGNEIARPFERVAIGQIVTHGYNAQRCFHVTLLGSIGEQIADDTALRTVSLSYSDDSGHTYQAAADKTVPIEGYSSRVDWRSLGSIRYPGRLFKIVDHGALKRIDSLDVQDER